MELLTSTIDSFRLFMTSFSALVVAMGHRIMKMVYLGVNSDSNPKLLTNEKMMENVRGIYETFLGKTMTDDEMETISRIKTTLTTCLKRLQVESLMPGPLEIEVIAFTIETVRRCMAILNTTTTILCSPEATGLVQYMMGEKDSPDAITDTEDQQLTTDEEEEIVTEEEEYRSTMADEGCNEGGEETEPTATDEEGEETEPQPTEETEPQPTEETEPQPTEETEPQPTATNGKGEETEPQPTATNGKGEETEPQPTATNGKGEETEPQPTATNEKEEEKREVEVVSGQSEDVANIKNTFNVHQDTVDNYSDINTIEQRKTNTATLDYEKSSKTRTRHQKTHVWSKPPKRQ
uniref:Uncharacterized protein n=1 Tax=Dikerogammarus haemobaphes virus 1 TaxID=2704946 RepID=A0A6G9HDE5_9VIRU|nr:hypothetical protein [Dikerogammarus haemobaphes virus 1]